MDGKTSGMRYGIERGIAPHVDPAWSEAVLLELRLEGVAGREIAAALAEVESHVVDSGQDAAAAFGEPVAYARSLGLPPDPAQERSSTPSAIATTLAQVVGAVLLIGGAYAVGAGEPAQVTWGVLGTVVLTAACSVLMLRFGEGVLRAALTSAWRFVLATSVTMVVVVLPAALLRTVAFEVDGWLMVGLGAVLLVGTAVVGLVRSAPDDPLTSPFDEAARTGGPAHPGRWGSVVVALTPLVGATLAAVALYVVGRTS